MRKRKVIAGMEEGVLSTQGSMFASREPRTASEYSLAFEREA